MKKLTLLLFMCSASFVLSQTVEPIANIGSRSDGNLDLIGSQINGGNFVITEKNEKELELDGSNYLFSNWLSEAKLYDKDNKGYKLVKCNFNVKLNRVEALLETDNAKEDQVYVFNSKDISKINIGDKQFVIKDIFAAENQLLEIIFIGKDISLFKYYSTKVVDGNIHPISKKKVTNDRITIKDNYYIEKDGKIEEFKINRSTILKLMANNKSEVKNFIKENKLSTSEDIDLFKIFNYYNTL